MMNSLNKKLLAIPLVIASCAQFEESTFAYATRSISSYIAGGELPQISPETSNFTFASKFVRLGRGPYAMVVLAYDKDGELEYVSNDGISLFFNKGILVRTIGFPNDFSRKFTSDYSILNFSSESKYQKISLSNPFVAEMSVNVMLENKGIEIKEIYGKKTELLLVQETIHLLDIRRKILNKYWIDTSTNKLLMSEVESIYNPKTYIVDFKQYN